MSRACLFIKNRWHIFLLGIVVVGILFGQALYVSKSRQYPQWDEHHYVSLSRSFYSIMREPSIDIWQRILTTSDYRQPLYPLMTATLLQFVGPERCYTVSLLFNGLFFVVTMFAIYGIMRCFTHRTNAVFASFLYAGMGFPLFYLHFAYSETATTMWVALSILFLLKSNGFSSRRMSLLAALTFVGGFLTRWVAPIFIIGAILWEFCVLARRWNRESRKQKTIRISNALLFVCISVLLSLLLYYIPNFQPFIAYTFKNSSNSPQWITAYKGIEYSNPLSIKTLIYYMNIISQNTIYYFVLFAIGIFFSIAHWKRYGGLLLTFFVPYVIFSVLFLWKDDRFIVPIYPIVAVLSVLILIGIKTRRMRFLIGSGIVVLSILSYFGCTWGIGPLGKRGLTDIVLPSFIQHPRRIYLTSMVWPPVKEYINAHKVVQLLLDNKMNSPISTSVLLVHEPLTNALYSYELYYTNGVFAFSYISPSLIPKIFDLLSNDFILIRNTPVEADGSVPKCFTAFHTRFPEVHKLIGEVIIPSDGSVISIYKKEQAVIMLMLEQAGNACIQDAGY